MLTSRADQLHPGLLELEKPQQFLAGRIGHHRVVLAMGEQHLGHGRLGLPARVGVAAAGHDPFQGQVATPIEGHGRPLGEAEQHRVLEGQAAAEGLKARPKGQPGLGQVRPAGVLQVVPLAAEAAGVGLGCPQGQQLAPLATELPPQLEQVFGIGPPAVQEHQSLAGVRRPALQGFANGLISLPGLHRFQRGGASTGFHAAWSQGSAPCWRLLGLWLQLPAWARPGPLGLGLAAGGLRSPGASRACCVGWP